MSVCNSSLSESFALNFQEIPIYKWDGMNSYIDLYRHYNISYI